MNNLELETIHAVEVETFVDKPPTEGIARLCSVLAKGQCPQKTTYFKECSLCQHAVEDHGKLRVWLQSRGAFQVDTSQDAHKQLITLASFETGKFYFRNNRFGCSEASFTVPE